MLSEAIVTLLYLGISMLLVFCMFWNMDIARKSKSKKRTMIYSFCSGCCFIAAIVDFVKFISCFIQFLKS